MSYHEPITLERDCEAILIPHGTPIALKTGSVVFVTQALGNSVTVNINGNLARIAGKDFDALGWEPVEAPPKSEGDGDGVGEVDEAQIWEQLRQCYDPEIPINIVDLGLIYECTIRPLDEGGNQVFIRMTLTAPGCGMGQVLVEDVRDRVHLVPHVTDVQVELTFDPPWNQSMMSEAARLETGLY